MPGADPPATLARSACYPFYMPHNSAHEESTSSKHCPLTQDS
jgi:hypothetical protein